MRREVMLGFLACVAVCVLTNCSGVGGGLSWPRRSFDQLDVDVYELQADIEVLRDDMNKRRHEVLLLQKRVDYLEEDGRKLDSRLSGNEMDINLLDKIVRHYHPPAQPSK